MNTCKMMQTNSENPCSCKKQGSQLSKAMHAEVKKGPLVLVNILSLVKDNLLRKERKDDGGINGVREGRMLD